MRRLLPYLALGIVYLVWGSTYLAIRLVVRELPPFGAAALRFLCAGIVMLFFAGLQRRGAPTLRQLVDYAFVGILLLGVSNALVMWSETRIPSGIAALVVASVTLWITFLDGLRPNGQPWTARVWVGTACGLLGVALVVRPEAGLSGYWKGILALQIACFTWAFGTLYAQAIPRRLPVLWAAAVEMLAASLVLVVESFAAREDLGRFGQASSTALLSLLYLAVFGSLLAFTAFSYCLHELPAATVGTYAYVNPIVAVLLGHVFLGEPLNPSLVLGAGLILLAIVVSTRRTSPLKPPSDLAELEQRA
jgi:drug/metabolite transporter (DMT)-like permease